jgi:hypothetical protein
MIRWAQLNVARYVGGILEPELNANIRAASLDIERLWEVSQIRRKPKNEQLRALADFIEAHNQKILDVIMAQEDSDGD